MEIKNLLDAASSNARSYIRNSINSKSKEDFNKIKKLFIDHKFESKSFEDSDLNIITFDWQSLDRDRNWWWQLQALPFLNWYANSFSLQTEEERLKYFSVCLDAINCWIKFAQKNSKSPLSWHDHAAAFRVRNLTNWLLFCDENGLPLTEDARAKSLASLIDEHLVWIGDDKNYSKHTNHGFDQAMIALTIGLMFECEDFEPYRIKNRERLKDEINFSFTNQGVHKENSPGYQKMMLNRLKQLRVLEKFGEKNISQMVECFINNAEEFLRAITLPNGYLPMIGDTQGGEVGLPYLQRDQLDVLDYSQSGYVVIRGKVLEKDFHLIFKASHFSHYHRHDDDLSIHLYYNGKEVLGDGGLGSHNEEENKRKALRSCVSHNAPYVINGKAARKVTDLNGALPSVYLKDKKIFGKSFCYGVELRREIDFSMLHDGKLSIKDFICKKSNNNILAVNFFSAEDLYEDEGGIIIEIDDETTLNINHKTPVDVKIGLSYISREFSKFSSAANFVFTPKVKMNDLMEFELMLGEKAKILHNFYYRGFGPINIFESGGWFLDKDYPLNVCHHVMSLRWISEVKSLRVKEKILRSFIAYHSRQEEPHSRYYLGVNADHTTSIRLSVLLNLLKDLCMDETIKALIRKELEKNIYSCLGDTYKYKNNHGLMVDKAILLCLIRDKLLFDNFKGDINFIIGRINEQINCIFDGDGYSKEHSTSYQEYNLGIIVDLLEVMESGRGIGFDHHINELDKKVDYIKNASRKVLGFLLKDDGTYVTVGDSFSQTKPNILKKAFSSPNPKVALLPESGQEGVFYNKTIGVAVFRDKNIHLVLNGSWHSYVHKQNDDLNIFLRINGKDLFVEGGYSDLVSIKKIDTRSEWLHSTIIPHGYPWLERNRSGEGEVFIAEPCYLEKENAWLFYGWHTRINGLKVRRVLKIFLTKKIISICDTVDGLDAKEVTHRFIINPQFSVEGQGGAFSLCSKNASLKETKAIEFSGRGGLWKQSSLSIILDGKEQEVIALDFLSNGLADLLISY